MNNKLNYQYKMQASSILYETPKKEVVSEIKENLFETPVKKNSIETNSLFKIPNKNICLIKKNKISFVNIYLLDTPNKALFTNSSSEESIFDDSISKKRNSSEIDLNTNNQLKKKPINEHNDTDIDTNYNIAKYCKYMGLYCQEIKKNIKK